MATGDVIIVEGPAGVGKSTLVRELSEIFPEPCIANLAGFPHPRSYPNTDGAFLSMAKDATTASGIVLGLLQDRVPIVDRFAVSRWAYDRLRGEIKFAIGNNFDRERQFRFVYHMCASFNVISAIYQQYDALYDHPAFREIDSLYAHYIFLLPKTTEALQMRSQTKREFPYDYLKEWEYFHEAKVLLNTMDGFRFNADSPLPFRIRNVEIWSSPTHYGNPRWIYSQLEGMGII